MNNPAASRRGIKKELFLFRRKQQNIRLIYPNTLLYRDQPANGFPESNEQHGH